MLFNRYGWRCDRHLGRGIERFSDLGNQVWICAIARHVVEGYSDGRRQGAERIRFLRRWMSSSLIVFTARPKTFLYPFTVSNRRKPLINADSR